MSWASAWLPPSLDSGHCSNATCSENPFLATWAQHLCYFSPPTPFSFSSKHLSISAELFVFLLLDVSFRNQAPGGQVPRCPGQCPARSKYSRVSGLPKGMFTVLESEMIFTSSPQHFWHQRSVSWKTIFP